MAVTMREIIEQEELAPTGGDTHFSRLAALTDIVSVQHPRLNESTHAASFVFRHWLSLDRVVARFPYVASVKNADVWGARFFDKMMADDIVGMRTTRITYSGDIPDFALDNIERAKQLGLHSVTVHSIYPMPIHHERLAFSDPVLIAWPRRISIEATTKGTAARRQRGANMQGAVIAVWGEDGKEL